VDEAAAGISGEFDSEGSFSDEFVLIVEAIVEELTVVEEVEVDTVLDSKLVSPVPEAVVALKFKATT
jgi:hypothetical protein